MNITINTLLAMKKQREKIAVITCYDASFSGLIQTTKIDVLLVGDSLGNVIQGENTTLPVTVDAMAYHTRCVAKTNRDKFIITDMPFMSYATPEQALSNATILMRAGAHMVKLEGGAWLTETVNLLSERGIPVCAHLGLTPQSIHQLGGYGIQGKDDRQAKQIQADSAILAQAGAKLLVLECVPASLAAEITNNIPIPTIGIGAGKYCDGQVIILYDILGISCGKIPSFARNFLEGQSSIQDAINAYAQAIKVGEFPGG